MATGIGVLSGKRDHHTRAAVSQVQRACRCVGKALSFSTMIVSDQLPQLTSLLLPVKYSLVSASTVWNILEYHDIKSTQQSTTLTSRADSGSALRVGAKNSVLPTPVSGGMSGSFASSRSHVPVTNMDQLYMQVCFQYLSPVYLYRFTSNEILASVLK